MSADAAAHTTPAPVDQTTETPFYIPATGSSTRPRSVLKHDDTFAVFDSRGDIGVTTGESEGVYMNDTRLHPTGLVRSTMQAPPWPRRRLHSFSASARVLAPTRT